MKQHVVQSELMLAPEVDARVHTVVRIYIA